MGNHKEDDSSGGKLDNQHENCCSVSSPRNQEDQHSECEDHHGSKNGKQLSSAVNISSPGCTKNYSAVKACLASDTRQAASRRKCCNKNGQLSQIVIE
ncbi:hypothetical protein OROHE_006371 [Orobanche hederae]